MQLVELQKTYQEFTARQAEIVALSRDETADVVAMKNEVNAGFPILSDPDAAIMKLYGVYNLLGDGIAAPSVFIVDHEGNMRTSYIGKSAGDRPTAESILQVIDLIANQDAE